MDVVAVGEFVDPRLFTLPSASAADGDEVEDRRCSCACSCCSSPSAASISNPSLPRPKKRKLRKMTDEETEAAASDSGGSDEGGSVAVARVEMESEVSALRHAVANQLQTIQDLLEELEEERSASATAASETMSMILRLQREKAEIQMEARNFKRFAEEKMAHDQEELAALDELILKRDEALQSLYFQIQAYRHRLLSFGIDPGNNVAELADAASVDLGDIYETRSPRFDYGLPGTTYDYPPLKCCTIPEHDDEEEEEVEAEGLKFAFGETPRGQKVSFYSEQVMDMSSSSCVMEKDVVGQPHKGCNAVPGSSIAITNDQEFKKVDEFPATVDRPLDASAEADDKNDRVYTIDMVCGVPLASESDGCKDELQEKVRIGEADVGSDQRDNVDIKKLYTRLQVLEEDREIMRQAIVSMRTEKTQLMLLKEMAQQLRKEVDPEIKIIKKKSLVTCLYLLIVPLFKWIISFMSWKKRASRSKYTFGLSSNNIGLLLLLDKSPQFSYFNSRSRKSMATVNAAQIGPS